MLEYNVLNYVDESKHEAVLVEMRTVRNMMSIQKAIDDKLCPDVTDDDISLQGNALITLTTELPAFWHAKHDKAFPKMISAYRSVASYHKRQSGQAPRVTMEMVMN